MHGCPGASQVAPSCVYATRCSTYTSTREPPREGALGHWLVAVNGLERQYGVFDIRRQDQELEELVTGSRQPKLPCYAGPLGCYPEFARPADRRLQ